jgi:hypothetical protein
MPFIRERRDSERRLVVRDGKLRDPEGRRHLPVRTLNVSDGGMLLAIRGGEHLRPGQTVTVAIDWRERGELIGRDDFLGAQVVRNEGRAGSACVVAVRCADAVGALRQAA